MHWCCLLNIVEYVYQINNIYIVCHSHVICIKYTPIHLYNIGNFEKKNTNKYAFCISIDLKILNSCSRQTTAVRLNARPSNVGGRLSGRPPSARRINFIWAASNEL